MRDGKEYVAVQTEDRSALAHDLIGRLATRGSADFSNNDLHHSTKGDDENIAQLALLQSVSIIDTTWRDFDVDRMTILLFKRRLFNE